MMAGMKRIYEELKKLQASSEKIEKMIVEMQHGVGRTVSSKMQISRDLSVGLKRLLKLFTVFL